MDAPPPASLDAALRAQDPDRWLSSRFVDDAAVRARLVALYTLDGEWRRVAALVSTPLAGEIRLAWWSEALDRFAAGGAADHPALAALGAEAAGALMPWLQATIEARRVALEAQGPSEAAEIAVMTAAAKLLDPDAPDDLRRLSVAAFPAVAHKTLARVYASGRQPGELEKRFRVAWAVARGTI